MWDIAGHRAPAGSFRTASLVREAMWAMESWALRLVNRRRGPENGTEEKPGEKQKGRGLSEETTAAPRHRGLATGRSRGEGG